MSIEAIIGIVVAIIGIVVSVFIGIAQLRQGRRNKRIKVKVSNGFRTFGSHSSDAMIFIEVGNDGDVPVVVRSVTLEWNRRMAILDQLDGEAQIPFTLLPQYGVTFWTPMRRYVAGLKSEGVNGTTHVRGRVSDAIGNIYYSKKFKINVDGWSIPDVSPKR